MSLDSIPDDPGFAAFMCHMYSYNKFKGTFDSFFVLETKDGERRFSAHKMLLALWSPKFEDMFYKQEKLENRVVLNDVNPEAFDDMLKFIYCIEPNLDSSEKAYELYKVAAKFQVTSLANLCQKVLSNMEVDIPNVFVVYEMAETMQDKYLMSKCTKVIQTKTKNIISHYGYCDVFPSMIHILLNSPTLSLESEYELLQWIFEWAKSQLDKSNYRSVRDFLSNYLSQMHFLALTNNQFAKFCELHEDFFEEKEALSIFMNIAIYNSYPLPGWYDKKAKLRIYTGLLS